MLTGSSALLLAGCGGGDVSPAPPPAPRIPAALASRLAGEAERLAELDPASCEARDAAARLRAHVIRSIPAVPGNYQEPLLSAVNDLAERLSPCRVRRRAGEGRGRQPPHDASTPRRARALAVWLRRNSARS